MTSYLRAALVVAGIPVAAVLLTFAWQAKADTPAPGCMTWDSARDKVKTDYGETATFIALSKNGSVIVFTINQTTGTWTLFQMPDAASACPLTAGQGWEAAPASIANPPATPEPKPPLPQMYAVPGPWGPHYNAEGKHRLTHSICCRSPCGGVDRNAYPARYSSPAPLRRAGPFFCVWGTRDERTVPDSCRTMARVHARFCLDRLDDRRG